MKNSDSKVLKYSPGGIFSYSAEEDEQFSYLSKNMLSFLGYTKEEFVVKYDNRFSQMVYSEDRERVLREIDEQIRVNPFDRCEYRIEKKDGTLVWVHDEGHIVTDETGKRWFYVVIVDISEQFRARAEAERVKDILDSVATGISVLHMPDPDHLTISYVNWQMFRMLGFTPGNNELAKAAAASGSGGSEKLSSAQEQMVREYTQDAFCGVHPADVVRLRKCFHDHFTDDYFETGNYRTIGADEKYYWIKEEVCLREVTPEYRIFYATYHDVSEEVRLNEELSAQLEREKQLREEAMAANAAKTEFLSRMSHDIRTPLNGIIGMTYLAGDQENPPRTRDCLQKIDRSSKFLLGLINDVLDMARAESSRFELNPEPYPIDEFNDYLDAVIRPLCREKNQKFVLNEQHAATDVVPVADKLRCNQIIFNLLSNAVKYTPAGGTISYSVQTMLTEQGRMQITHEISDTGIGMSDAFQKILFEPFSQESRDDISEKRGTGLGLAIVKKLVDLMQGQITVDSHAGKGTTFRVVLTFDTVPAEKQQQPDADAAIGQSCPIGILQDRHILLCEDHPLNQEIARTLLERQGAVVEVASNGKLGMERFAASPLSYFDAVLMDVRMPVMDGYEATRAIRALPRADAKTVPILAMTADAFSGDVKRCLEAGMNGHIAKPIDPGMLNRQLAEVIAEKQ